MSNNKCDSLETVLNLIKRPVDKVGVIHSAYTINLKGVENENTHDAISDTTNGLQLV
jgi:hypothetical protein